MWTLVGRGVGLLFRLLGDSDVLRFASLVFLVGLSLSDDPLELELPDREDELLPELLLPLLELLLEEDDLDLLLPFELPDELLLSESEPLLDSDFVLFFFSLFFSDPLFFLSLLLLSLLTILG